MKHLSFFVTGLLVFLLSCEGADSNGKQVIKNDTLNTQTNTVSAEKTDSACRITDTLLDIGNHKLHFKIYNGKGTPVLFENGAGDDCSVWDTILKPLWEITGATLITYDRAGFGSSTIDTADTAVSSHGVLSGLTDLETGLQILGYNKDIVLVSHSYGGYYTTLYAGKHPDLVKSIVLLDVNHNFYEGTAEQEMKAHERETMEWKKKNIAFYYMAVNLAATSELMKSVSIPQNIPVVDFIDGISFLEKKEDVDRWKKCHRDFVQSHPKSTAITANGCEHYIWFDNPGLVISSIAKSYAETQDEKRKTSIYGRLIDYVITQENYANAKK